MFSFIASKLNKNLPFYSLAIAIIVGGHAGSALAINLNDVDDAAVGGIENWYDVENSMPNVVSMFHPAGASFCSGTLLNSRTVITAAHCGIDDRTATKDSIFSWYNYGEVRFNPAAKIPSSDDRAISGALVHPAYTPQVMELNDLMIISLDAPVTTIGPVKIINSEEELDDWEGMTLLTGYGQIGTGSTSVVGNDSRRRIATSLLGGFARDPETGQRILKVQFRNPLSPDDPNDFDIDEPVPQGQGGAAPGDSGGPLFAILPDGSLLQIGVASTSGTADDREPGGVGFGYGSITSYVFTLDHMKWLLENDPLRLTDAVAGQWDWSDARAWRDTLGRSEVPDNIDGGFAGYGTLGRYYDVALSGPSQITVDMSPVIDSLVIAHPGAALDIIPGSELQVNGGTKIAAGSLAVDGVLDTGLLLQTGGQVSGAGTIFAPYGYRHNGGILAPGGVTAPGTLSIDGDYRQGRNAALVVRAGADGSDHLAVSGEAKLAGTLVLASSDYAPAVKQRIAVVSAEEGVSGNFKAIASFLPAFRWTTSKVGGELAVVAGVNYVDSVSSITGRKEREAAFGSAVALQALAGRLPAASLQQAAAQTPIGNLPFPATPELAIAALNTLNSSQLPVALKTLPPSGFYGQTAFALSTSRLVSRVLTDRLNEVSGTSPLARSGFSISTGSAVDAQQPASASAVAASEAGSGPVIATPPVAQPTTPFGIFVAGTLVNSGKESTTSFTTSGLTAGIDYRLSPALTAGFAVTYADDRRSARGMVLDGKSVAPTLYGRMAAGRFFLDAYLGYAFNEVETRRTIIMGDTLLTAQAKPKGGQWLAGALAGARFDVPTSGQFASLTPLLSLTPFVGLDATRVHVDGYTETGAGGFAVGLAARDLSEVRATAGLEAAWTVAFENVLLTPRLKASITQRFGDLTDTTAAYFLAAPDLPFQVRGAKDARTYASVGAGLGLQANEALSGLVSYQADISGSGVLDNRFTAKLQYRF